MGYPWRGCGKLDAMRLRAATFNIRKGTAWDGLDSWPLRRAAAAEAVARLRADVVGLQEVYGFQQRDLLRRLPGYAACGAGRDDGRERGERCAILYDARRLALERWTTRWFSDTPDVPGSVSWGAPPPRVATLAWFARARRRAARRPTPAPPPARPHFAVANVHWDGASAAARERSAEALLEWIDDGLPWLVLGDLNTTADDASLQRLLAAGLRDPLGHLGTGGPGAGTHHHWDGRTDWTRIDFVLRHEGVARPLGGRRPGPRRRPPAVRPLARGRRARAARPAGGVPEGDAVESADGGAA